jgi:hypothetical protein
MSFEALEVRTQILAHENLANITQIYQNTKKKKKLALSHQNFIKHIECKNIKN